MSNQFRRDPSSFSLHPNFPVFSRHKTTTPAPDFQVREPHIWLGYWDHDQRVMRGCRLRRISRVGALVQFESHLPEGKAVWVGLRGQGARLGSVPARVSKAVLVAPRVVLAWLDFGVPCPMELLYAAVFATDELEATLN